MPGFSHFIDEFITIKLPKEHATPKILTFGNNKSNYGVVERERDFPYIKMKKIDVVETGSNNTRPCITISC